MSTTPKTKRKLPDKDTDDSDELDLFAKLTTHDSDDASDDGDSTDEDYDNDDSDESVISGLDEEEESSGDEDVLMDEDEDEESEDDDGSEDAEDEDSEEDQSDKEINEISSKSKKLLKKLSKDKESSSKNETSDIVNNNTEEPSTSSSKHATSSQIAKQSRKAKKLSKKSAEEGSKSADSSKSNGSSESVSVNTPGEYDFDSSDEEDLRNTVGNIPMQWYREYEHIGYNLLGKKIIKPASGDQLDNFLNKMDNPDYWRTVVDKTTGQSVVISDKDAEMIKRLRRGKYSDANYDPYQPWVDFFTHEKMLHPLTNHPATKASFIPSKWERLKVGRMVHAIKMGWMKPKTEKKDDEEENEDDMQNFYMLWNKDDQSDITKRYLSHIPAPKLKLPGHEESYNPPPEYLPTEEEMLAWKDQDPEDRRLNFLPQKFSSLRQVRAYGRFINERFERCLDLYLCPRQRKLRMNVNPEDLLPKLPKPRDLQPFPTVQALVYRGHTDLVRCISPDPTGQWLVSGSDDQTLRLWEVTTGRCMKTLQMGGVVRGVTWNPNASVCLVAAIVEDSVIIINPGLGDKLVISSTDTLLEASQEHAGTSNSDQAEWQTCTGTDHEEGFRMRIKHKKTLGQVTWQARGDYLAVVIPGGDTKSVLIHQISRQRSQNPFRKSKGLVQCVLFHPTRPFFFVATQRYVRVYNLLKQELSKKLMTNVKWVSSMAVHSGGDNVIIGSYDCRLSWFDLDLSTKPYQTLRHHKKAIRQVCYHKKYPLFASASDDGSLIICHGRVYNDLLQNPLIVPVKVLRGHNVKNNLGVLDCAFHPTQPWVFSSGGDGTIRLFS